MIFLFTFFAARAATLSHRRELGQASAEYALVIVGAAVLGSLLIAWAAKSQLIADLFDHVLDLVKGKTK